MSLPNGSSHDVARSYHGNGNHTRTSSDGSSHEIGALASNDAYYGNQGISQRNPKNRTFSVKYESTSKLFNIGKLRRFSQDLPDDDKRLLLDVDETYQRLLASEDTDDNIQITIEDQGPKVMTVPTAASGGYNMTDIQGTYKLTNLLQELTLAKDKKQKVIVLDAARLRENPVDRLSRFIKDDFWKNLTRSIDEANIGKVARDPKDWTSDPRPRVYIPPGAPEQFEYYSKYAAKNPELRLDVQWLPTDITPEYVRDLNNAPGLLALAMDEVDDGHGGKTLRGKQFIVPGGRFNELYGWDSYMASLGLLENGRVDICKSMVENFSFCIEHYGKILNANRSYYLGRSQPPFLSDMVLRVYGKLGQTKEAKEFLHLGTLACIKEYYSVWMAEPRLDKRSGLSRYRPTGVGVPPETESTHFLHVLTPYAEKHGLSMAEFVEAYNMKRIDEPELDEYFLHDRAVRESGHDTSYRLEKVAANLATVDLNSCLYKIETDISRIIQSSFGDSLHIPKEFRVKGMPEDVIEHSASWDRRAKKRRSAMDKYMWNESKGMFFDYNTVTRERTDYESVTTYWTMWAGVATPMQAAGMMHSALHKFEMFGGLVAGTEESRGAVGLHRPNRQWDYPFGWAPHQILAWAGFARFGYTAEAERLAYKWCYMVTSAFVGFGGVIVEKYDLTRKVDPQRVEAEYGNQGADFKGVPREGFGWVNASYVVGLGYLSVRQRRALGALATWEEYTASTLEHDDDHDSDHHSGVKHAVDELAIDEHEIAGLGPHGDGSHMLDHRNRSKDHA